MSLYARIWSCTCWTIMTLVCVGAAAVGPLSFYLALFILAAGAAAAAYCVRRPAGADTPAVSSEPGPGLLAITVAAGAVLSAAAATLALSPWLLVAFALAAGLTCPGFVNATLVRLAGPRRPQVVSVSDAPIGGAGLAGSQPLSITGQDIAEAEALAIRVDAVYLECLSTTELCRTWRESFVRLQRASVDDQRALIVASRARCLDELCRRDPDGVDAWLCRGPRAASGPDRYMRHGREHPNRRTRIGS